MVANNLKSIIRPKYKQKNEEKISFPNVLNRDFTVDMSNKKFATDITYIPTRTKMMYLSTVIDLYDNYPIAWKLSDSQDKSLSVDTIKKLSMRTLEIETKLKLSKREFR